jgi:hypothetical protein
MEFGNATVFGVAQPAHEGDDVESELVMRECKVRFRFRPVGAVEARTSKIGTAPNMKSKACDSIKRGDSTVIGIVSPESVLAFRAVVNDRGKRLNAGRAWSWSNTPG